MISNFDKAIKGVSSQLIVTIAIGVFEIISFSIMSRILSPQDFGYYNAVLAIVTIFASFSDTGIGSAIIQKKNADVHYLNNAFSLSFIFAVIISLVLIISSGFLSKTFIVAEMKTPMMLMSITLFLNCMSSISLSILQKKLKFLSIGVIRLVSIVVTTIMAVFLALKGFGYYAILTKAILSSVIVCCLSYSIAGIHFRFEINRVYFKSIFGFSGWLMASVFFRNLSSQIDRVLMPRLLSVSALGEYSRPKEFISQVSDKTNGIFDSVLFPILSSIQDDYSALANAFKKSFFLMNLLASFLFCLFIFNSNLIIRLFLGVNWIHLSPIFIILSVDILFNVEGRLSDCFLRGLAMTRQQFIFRIIEALFKIISVVIGSSWGIKGVALAIAFSESLVRIVKVFFVSHIISIPINNTISLYFKSCKWTILFIPIIIILKFFVPSGIHGEIIIFMSTISLAIIIFVFCPRFVGSYYYENVYLLLMNRVKILFNR